MFFYHPKQAKPFMLWVADLEEGLQVDLDESERIAHETWPYMPASLKDARKNICGEIKRYLREHPAHRYEYWPLPLPEMVVLKYAQVPKRTDRVWDQVRSERALGIAEDWSDLDHYAAVKGDRH